MAPSGEETGTSSATADNKKQTSEATTALAPGQKWNPADKIRFAAPKKRTERPGTVWVLNAQQQPEFRRVLLGISDGTSTEVISGEIKAGDLVIVGDSTQGGSAPGGQRGGFGFGFGPPGGGGGGGGGRGR
jgi:hypothetical protein